MTVQVHHTPQLQNRNEKLSFQKLSQGGSEMIRKNTTQHIPSGSVDANMKPGQM